MMNSSSWLPVRRTETRLRDVTMADWLNVAEEQVMLMSRDFEVVYEAPLRTEEFGEGTSLPSPQKTFR